MTASRLPEQIWLTIVGASVRFLTLAWEFSRVGKDAVAAVREGIVAAEEQRSGRTDDYLEPEDRRCQAAHPAPSMAWARNSAVQLSSGYCI